MMGQATYSTAGRTMLSEIWQAVDALRGLGAPARRCSRPTHVIVSEL
jgi:hypothetical protein